MNSVQYSIHDGGYVSKNEYERRQLAEKRAVLERSNRITSGVGAAIELALCAAGVGCVYGVCCLMMWLAGVL